MDTTYRKLLFVLVPVLVAGGLIVGWSMNDSGSSDSQQAAAQQAPRMETPSQAGDASAERSGTTGSAASSNATAASSVPQNCSYDPGQALDVSADQLVSFQDPSLGAEESPVTVVEFFDPNCSHCQAFHPIMKEMVSRYSDRVRFVMKPFPLWPRSVNQVEAMVLAGRRGNSYFYDMIDAQIARGVSAGLSDQQLIDIAEQIGLDVEAFSQALESDEARNRALYYRKLGQKYGIKSTPTLVINGRVVAGTSRTVECVSALIEEQLQQASASTG